MAFLNQGLYLVSDGLLIPVIVLLLFFFVRSLTLLGSLYGLFMQRLKQKKVLTVIIERIRKEPRQDQKPPVEEGSLFMRFLDQVTHMAGDRTEIDKVLGDFELEGQRELDQSKILARTGPMLGLMGTLIPMGPALISLASGNLEIMAQNMRIAFSTTVVGVFAGAVGFFSYTVKRRWFMEDAGNLAYIAELLDTRERPR